MVTRGLMVDALIPFISVFRPLLVYRLRVAILARRLYENNYVI
jgi:hypothetical protein